MQFNIVVCGLDSVDARRWMSATLVNLVDPEIPESLKPLIDGGTEGDYSPRNDSFNQVLTQTRLIVQDSRAKHA